MLHLGLIEGRHFWRQILIGKNATPVYFCLDEFRAAFREQRLTGLSFIRKCILVD